MAAKSKNKYDVYNWIKDQVIPSCNSIQQNLACDKLILQFEKTYQDYDLARELMYECINHDFEVMRKNKNKNE